MVDSLPTVDEIRAALTPLSMRQLEGLSVLSGVPTTTIAKIRRGETTNPGIETVRRFVPHIEAARGMPPDGRPTIEVSAPQREAA